MPDNICECGKCFEKKLSLYAHYSHCIVHLRSIGYTEEQINKTLTKKVRLGKDNNFSKEYLGEEKFNEMHRKQGESYRRKYYEGKISNHQLGKKHTPEEIQKIREGTLNYVMNVLSARPRYNKQSIPILDNISKQYGWNLQHAENGGEFYTGVHAFVDGYDKENNVVVEYDEPRHYIDPYNNILKSKDILRQQRIIEHLHCKFYRFNEVTQKLWCVNP